MSGVRVRWGPSCAVSEVRCMSPRSNVVQAGCPAWDRGPRLCIEPLRRDTKMTLGDWVALAMLWWRGGGRPLCAGWLSPAVRVGWGGVSRDVRNGRLCHRPRSCGVGSAGPGPRGGPGCARGRARRRHHRRPLVRHPLPDGAGRDRRPAPGPVDPRRSGGAQGTHGCDRWLPRRLRVCPRCGSGAGIWIGAMRRHSGQRTGPGRRLGRASRCAGCRRSHGWCTGLWCGHHVPSRAQWAGA